MRTSLFAWRLFTLFGRHGSLSLSRPAELGSVKEGSYIIIDGEPCKVVSREHFKPGKHGSAKVRLVAISLFTGSKKSYVSPAESRVDIPMIDKGPDR